MINSSFDSSPVVATIEHLNTRGGQQQLIQALIALSSHLPEFPEALKTAENQVEGCETATWLVKTDEGILADSQSRIMRGLLLILIYQHMHPGQTPFDLKQLSASKRLAWDRLQDAL